MVGSLCQSHLRRCLVVRRGSPASSRLLKGMLFPCLPLTFLISEKSCLLGWEGEEWYQKRGAIWKLVHVILGKGSRMGKGSDVDCAWTPLRIDTLCLRQMAHHALPSLDRLSFSPASEVSKTDLWKSSNHGPALPSSVSVCHGWPFLSKNMCPHPRSLHL